jgi:predicted acetyltransferase
LSKQEKERLIQFVAYCFEKDEPEKRKTLYFSPTFRHLLLFENKELISYLRIIKRKAKFKGKNITIGGIGAVSTKHKYRNKGYATKLLKKAMTLLKNEGADIGLLQTNPQKGENLYKRAGFFLAKKPYTFKDIHGKLHTTSSGGVMMASINSQDVLDEILSSEEILHIGDGDW